MADRYTRRINLYINDKEVRNDIASIRKEMMKMQKAQNRMVIGSKEYIAQGRKIGMLRNVMNKHNADLRKTTQSWFSLSRAAEKANKYMSGAMALVAGLMGVVMGLRKAAQAAMEFEERLDNLSALTGLEGRELEWLSDTAKDTSVVMTETGVRIKQSASDIVDAYTKVGSQRPELLRNKEALHEVTKAGIILSEAAKGELEPAVKALTMAMNQHNIQAEGANRIINAMAAGSKLGAANIPYLTAVIEKSGTTLNLMNISLEENIALTEAIAPSFSEAAAAGTSLDRTFLKMKAEGIGYKDGVFDISRALEELKYRFANGESSVDLFGLRHAKMAEILVKNRNEFKRYLAGVTDTSIAFEQAGKNTDNTATKLAQAKNKMTLVLMEFGETINPIFLKSTNLMRYMIKGLVVLPDYIRKNQIILISLASAVMAYNAALVLSIALQIKKNILSKLEFLHNAALVGIATLRVASMKVQLMFMRKNTAAQLTNVAALKKAIFYQQAFGKALMANPVGLAIAAIGLLIVAIKSYDKYSKQAVARAEEKAEAIQNLKEKNQKLTTSYSDVAKEMGNLNRMSIQEKKDLQEKIDKTIELAEAELILQRAKQKELFEHNAQATMWQKTLNIFKSGGNAYVGLSLNAIDGAKNGKKAADTLNTGIEDLQNRINNFKQSGSTLDDIFQAEAIADSIGTDTLAELEEKLSVYQTALKNLKVGTEDYLRVAEKLRITENAIKTARENATVTTEEQAKKIAAAAKAKLKAEITAVTASHNLKMAEIKKQHLQGKISEDEYNGQLLKQELLFIQDKLIIYKVGSVQYAKAYNKSLSKQVEADAKTKELLLKAQTILADAQIATFEEGLEKEIALQNRKFDAEKLKLEEQLVQKEELSQKELELNDVIHQTIEAKETEHQTKIKEIKDAAKITDLENLVDAAEPLDENMVELEQMQVHFDAKQNLINAQYEKEKKEAGKNQSALLAAEANFNRKSLANKKNLIDAEFELTQTKIATAQSYISALAGIFSQESAMGKALFLFNQGLAIAEIWINTAKANAVATAASPMTFGQPWVASNTLQAGINTALVVAQTVGHFAKFADGKYPDSKYNTTLNTGMYGDKPQYALFNEVPGQPEMVIDGLTTRKINVNYPGIMEAIYAVRDGRTPQFANGKYPVSSSSYCPPFGDDPSSDRGGGQDDYYLQTNSTDHVYKILAELTTEIQELRKYRPTVAVETIERERTKYIKIQDTKGL